MAGLTEIAILSEIAAQRAGAPVPELARVADTARQLVDKTQGIAFGSAHG